MLRAVIPLIVMMFGAVSLGRPALAEALAEDALPVLQGAIHVVDGDTVIVAGQRLRLHGIDAPETAQRCGGKIAPIWPCGAWTTGEVRARYEGRFGLCEITDWDRRYNRAVGRCQVAGEDMGEALVTAGLAFAYLRYSRDYAGAEREAARAGRGLHAVGVGSPEDFRIARKRAGRALQVSAPHGCAIKGNISVADGSRIFHVPGQAHYAETRISAGKGEMWFCSEAQAVAAGWRKSRR